MRSRAARRVLHQARPQLRTHNLHTPRISRLHHQYRSQSKGWTTHQSNCVEAHASTRPHASIHDVQEKEQCTLALTPWSRTCPPSLWYVIPHALPILPHPIVSSTSAYNPPNLLKVWQWVSHIMHDAALKPVLKKVTENEGSVCMR